jgi:hypothetical protein
MHKDLITLYTETGEFSKIPPDLRPRRGQNLGKGLRGENSRLLMQGKLDEGGSFEVHQYKHSKDAWMDVHRADGTLAERQLYNASAFAYAHTVTRFDEMGDKPVYFSAHARDGRLIEETALNPGGQLERLVHNYPDYKLVASHEMLLFAPKMDCAMMVERDYHDDAGKKIKIDRHFNHDQKIIRTVHYFDDGKSVRAIADFLPGHSKESSMLTFTREGLKNHEKRYDDQGQCVSHCEYHTEGQDDPNNPAKKVEETYRGGKLVSRLENHEDGTHRLRKDYEADGKTVKLIHNYNANGERPRIITKYKQGKPYKRVYMGVGDDDEDPQAQRIILYTDKGGAYRSRMRNRWDTTGDEYWSETEIDPATGYPLSSLHPTPTGLVRQGYDPKTGRLKVNERYSEPELGETLQQRTDYYPASALTSHPEHNSPLVTHRVENFEEDGATRKDAVEYRTDSSIKFKEHADPEGKWIRRAYAPGTKEADEQTPIIYESVQRENGKLESSSLYAHSDPTIIALHKEYDTRGNPVSVRIEHIDGEEELTWEQYAKRKKAELLPAYADAALLATITPDIREQQGKEVHHGATVITMQGSIAALKAARSQVMRRIPFAQTELDTGERQWLQYRGEVGHYIPNGSPAPSPEFQEKANVLKVTIPYQRLPQDTWPQTFVQKPDQQEAIDMFRQRGVEEAIEALTQVQRATSCDMRLRLEPYTMKHKEVDGRTQYFPFVHVTWPNSAYLPKAQYEVITNMLSNQILKRNLSCSTMPDKEGLDVGAATTSFLSGVATKIAKETAKQIANGFIPHAAHSR